VDEVLITGSPQTYLDIAADEDIQDADFISFTNDVPVTSSLPTPVNTTLVASILTTNQVVSVYPASMANISVRQQVTIGNLTSISLISDTETVVVLQVFADHFTALVQNVHLAGEPITATAKYGQPVTIIASAFDQFWFAGDINNPNYVYYSAKSYPQYVSSAAYFPITTSDDPVTVIDKFKGNLYCSTVKGGWFSIAPGAQVGQSPTPYPTACKFGCVAPLGYVVTEEGIYYQAIDGIRFFAGGESVYLTQDQEFIFQDVGSTPIVEANQSMLNQTRMAYWGNMIFISYIGVDGNRHRLIFHTQYKRWRNDDVDAQSITYEPDTKALIYGDSNGLVHQDRIGSYDEGNNAGALVQLPIQMDLQTPYLNQGMPAENKQYQELTIDALTNGQTVTATLLFNDGEFSEVIGTVTTTERQRINLVLNNGLGYMAYKVSLQLTCSALAQVLVFQCAIRALQLAKTRLNLDTFNLKMSIEASKICKQLLVEYTSSATIAGTIYYDDPCWPPFTFTLPNTNGVRNPLRLRLPATKFRYLRCTLVSASDFMVWNDSVFEAKPVCASKGYFNYPLLTVEV
jgi:hypothetical protein